jgi:hypothetical protein
MSWDPRILPGFLLSLTGFGVVLLVSTALTATSTATALGKCALAVVLLALFVRIWRADEDAGAAALILTLLWGLRAVIRYSLSGSHSSSHASGLLVIYAVALLEISVGLWRAHQWARWSAGVASILASTACVLMLKGVYPKDGTPPPVLSTPGILVLFLAFFWAAIALYLCLPSTGARFDEMRSALE